MVVVADGLPLLPAGVPLLPPWRQQDGIDYLRNVSRDPRPRPIRQLTSDENNAHVPVAAAVPAALEVSQSEAPTAATQDAGLAEPPNAVAPGPVAPTVDPHERLVELLVSRGSLYLRGDLQRVVNLMAFLDEHPDVRRTLDFPRRVFMEYANELCDTVQHIRSSIVEVWSQLLDRLEAQMVIVHAWIQNHLSQLVYALGTKRSQELGILNQANVHAGQTCLVPALDEDVGPKSDDETETEELSDEEWEEDAFAIVVVGDDLSAEARDAGLLREME